MIIIIIIVINLGLNDFFYYLVTFSFVLSTV